MQPQIVQVTLELMEHVKEMLVPLPVELESVKMELEQLMMHVPHTKLDVSLMELNV